MTATELRAALARLRNRNGEPWNQADCARELEIPYRQVRYWASGQLDIPRYVELSLAWLIAQEQRK